MTVIIVAIITGLFTAIPTIIAIKATMKILNLT